MPKFAVCFTNYGQTYVEAPTQEEAEKIAMGKLYETGKPEFTDGWNSWEMVDETEVVDDLSWNQRKKELLDNPVEVEIKLTKEEIAMYCSRPKVMSYSPEKMKLLVDYFKDALFDNGFWDILKVVVDTMEEDDNG